MTQPVLDLIELPTHNLLTMAIGDLSTYPSGFSILNPTLEITPPGWNRGVHSFTTGTVNIFNSNNLGITCATNGEELQNLPDGKWELKFSISPANKYFVEKNFFKTDLIKAKFLKSFLCLDMKDCDIDMNGNSMETLQKIWSYIMFAQAEGNNCNYEWAMKHYLIADKMLNTLSKTH